MMTAKSKVVIFGDSLFKGVFFNENTQKYQILKKTCVDLIIENNDMIVNNMSKFGLTTDRAVSYIRNHLNENNDYQYAIIELGGNDCDFDWGYIANNPKIDHVPKVNLEDFEKNIIEILNEIKKHDIIPVVVSLPPISSKKYFNWFTKKFNKERILEWLKEENNIYKHHEMYNLCLSKIALKMNVKLIDLRLLLLTIKDFEKYLCIDGIHLNENGHRVIEQSFKKGEIKL